MKRFAPLFIVLLFVSCSPFGFNPEGYEVLSEPLEVAWPKAAALEYIPDTEPSDNWKSPHETIEDGGGDCEDIATYLVYLLGPDAGVANIKLGNGSHCIVTYHGEYIDAGSIGYYYEYHDIDIINTATYSEVMALTTHRGALGL